MGVPRAELLQPLDDPVVGRTVCAALPIKRGELIFCEGPLLRGVQLSSLPSSELGRLFESGAEELGFPWAITSICNLQAYTTAAPALRAHVLDRMCSFDVHTAALPADSGSEAAAALPPMISDAMRVSAWFRSQPALQPPTPGREHFEEEELTRAQCCFDMNAHEFEESPAVGSAVNPLHLPSCSVHQAMRQRRGCQHVDSQKAAHGARSRWHCSRQDRG